MRPQECRENRRPIQAVNRRPLIQAKAPSDGLHKDGVSNAASNKNPGDFFSQSKTPQTGCRPRDLGIGGVVRAFIAKIAY